MNPKHDYDCHTALLLGFDQDDKEHLKSLLQGTGIEKVIELSEQEDLLNTIDEEDPRIVITALPIGSEGVDHPFIRSRWSRRFSILTIRDDDGS